MDKLNLIQLAVRIGYAVGPHRDINPCPACGAPTRHTKSNDTRGAVGVTPDGMGWRCFQCEAGGSVQDFLQYAHMRDSSNVPAELSVAAQLEPTSAEVYELKRYPYPNIDVVNQFWGRCHEPSAEQVAYLEKRYKRSLADTNLYPYCRELLVRDVDPWWMKNWAQSGHNLIFSLFDARGERRSVLARKTTPGSPKSKAPPKMARAGLSLLSIRRKSTMGVIVEGELDWLAWCLWGKQSPNVVGVFSGSWRIEVAQRWPHIHSWYVATDNDPVGDRYAQEIIESFEEVGRTCQRITGSLTAQTELPLV